MLQKIKRKIMRVIIDNVKNIHANGSVKRDQYNPIGIEGTIVNRNGKYNPIIVLWDNGIRNSYQIKNLKEVL
jgi:hypothetical protein